MEKQKRLKKNEDFQRVIGKGQNLANSSFAAYFLKSDQPSTRIGISVSSKLGKAVIRNKIKRQVRMMVSEIYDDLESLDIVIIVRKGYLNKSFADNLIEIKKLIGKIIKGSNVKGV